MKRISLLMIAVIAWSAPAHALDRALQHGRALLTRMCSECHAVGETGRSPHPDAPRFRSFSEEKLYDEDFRQRLQDGLSTMHPDMPTFHFSERDAQDAVDYLKWLRDRRSEH
jgi:mono/diheme cytochrome c family protein